MASDTLPKFGSNGKVREKVHLKPGFHLVDWMRLMSVSGKTKGAKKVTLKELAEHSSEFDCWTAYNGKVYNITQYLHYHPGGVPKLMQGAGKDCTVLFNKYHRWVNIDSMLAKFIIGVLDEEEVEGNSDSVSIDLKAQITTSKPDTIQKLSSLSLTSSSSDIPINHQQPLPPPPLVEEQPPSISVSISISPPVPILSSLEAVIDSLPVEEKQLANSLSISPSALVLDELNKEEN
jgi:cytochrome b involved in lipid metabolism